MKIQRLEKYSERFDNKDNELVEGVFNPETWGKRMVEEPKQETLEEAAENFWLNDDSMTDNDRISYVNGFVQGAKWQQERMYSEEEVLEFTQTMIMQYKFGNTNIEQMDLLKETLQQFKNK